MSKDCSRSTFFRGLSLFAKDFLRWSKEYFSEANIQKIFAATSAEKERSLDEGKRLLLMMLLFLIASIAFFLIANVICNVTYFAGLAFLWVVGTPDGISLTGLPSYILIFLDESSETLSSLRYVVWTGVFFLLDIFIGVAVGDLLSRAVDAICARGQEKRQSHSLDTGQSH